MDMYARRSFRIGQGFEEGDVDQGEDGGRDADSQGDHHGHGGREGW